MSPALLAATASPAQLSVEEVISGGVLNPTDISWHYYLDQMKRFPDRLGFICVNGYELDKTGNHVGGQAILSECSQRGNAPSMVYLADMLEAGRWLRRAAAQGDADAAVLIRANFDRRLAANARPAYD